MGGRASHLDLGNIRNESAAGFVSWSHNPRKTGIPERLTACGVCDHYLTAAKERINFACTKHRLIAIGAGYNDDFVQDVIFDVRVSDDPV